MHRNCDKGSGPTYSWSVYVALTGELVCVVESPTLLLRYQDIAHSNLENHDSAQPEHDDNSPTTTIEAEDHIHANNAITTTTTLTTSTNPFAARSNNGITNSLAMLRIRKNNVQNRVPSIYYGNVVDKKKLAMRPFLGTTSGKLEGTSVPLSSNSATSSSLTSEGSSHHPPHLDRASRLAPGTYSFKAELSVLEQDTVVHSEKEVSFSVSPLSFR